MKTTASPELTANRSNSIPRKVAALLAGIALAGSLAACGADDSAASGDNAAQTSSSAVASSTASSSTTSSSAPDPSMESSSETSTSAEASASPSTTTEEGADSSAKNNADLLADFEEVDAGLYTGNGSGDLAGTRFTTPDESIHCHIAGENAVCAVPGEHSEWPDADRGNDGVRDMPNAPAPTVIGWMRPLGSPLGTKPKNWLQQGTFPSVNTGVPLEDGKKMEVLTSLETGDTVTCGSKDNNMTCINGDHGFTVGTDTYATW